MLLGDCGWRHPAVPQDRANPGAGCEGGDARDRRGRVGARVAERKGQGGMKMCWENPTISVTMTNERKLRHVELPGYVAPPPVSPIIYLLVI